MKTKSVHEVSFLGYDCILHFPSYNNGRKAIQLIGKEDGEPIATATVNLRDEPLAPDTVFIKDYSENNGMLATLVKAGIVSEPLRYVLSGFVKIPVCKLLIPIV